MDELLTTSACTLPTLERPVRLAELDALFAGAVEEVTWDGPVLRLRLGGPTGLADRVRDLTDRESRCCAFFTFALSAAGSGTGLNVESGAWSGASSGAGERLVLEVAVPAEHAGVLRSLAARAVAASGAPATASVAS